MNFPFIKAKGMGTLDKKVHSSLIANAPFYCGEANLLDYNYWLKSSTIEYLTPKELDALKKFLWDVKTDGNVKKGLVIDGKIEKHFAITACLLRNHLSPIILSRESLIDSERRSGYGVLVIPSFFTLSDVDLPLWKEGIFLGLFQEANFKIVVGITDFSALMRKWPNIGVYIKKTFFLGVENV